MDIKKCPNIKLAALYAHISESDNLLDLRKSPDQQVTIKSITYTGVTTVITNYLSAYVFEVHRQKDHAFGRRAANPLLLLLGNYEQPLKAIKIYHKRINHRFG